MWGSPRETLRAMLDSGRRGWLSVHFLVMEGLCYFLNRATGSAVPMVAMLSRAESATELALLIFGFLVAICILGYLIWTGFGLLFFLFGKLFRGKGSYLDCLCALGWGYLPNFALFTLHGSALVAVLVLHDIGWLQTPLVLAVLVVQIWKLKFCCQTLGEAHQFSSQRALGVILSSWILVFVLAMGTYYKAAGQTP